MDPKSREQTELLRSIWSEIKTINQSLGKRIDATNTRLDDVKGELKQLRGEVTQLRGEVTELRDDMKLELTAVRTATQDGFQLLARRDARHEGELDDLRTRLDRVEKHVGLR